MIHKLCLGTAQFGSEYGIRPVGRPAKKPNEAEVKAMLEYAAARGVRWLDTAAAYGDAEDQIGRARYELASKPMLRVSTKIRPNAFDHCFISDRKELREALARELLGSRKRIKGVPDVVLLHSAKYAYRPDVLSALRSETLDSQRSLWGISCYEPQEAVKALAARATCIQAPFNLLDTRFSAVFHLAREMGAKVFARQPFLQSILLLELDEIPERAQSARPLVQRFIEWSEKRGVTRLHASLAYALAHPYIDYVVFGVENREQLSEVLDVATVRSDSIDLEELGSLFSGTEAVVNPSRWS